MTKQKPVKELKKENKELRKYLNFKCKYCCSSGCDDALFHDKQLLKKIIGDYNKLLISKEDEFNNERYNYKNCIADLQRKLSDKEKQLKFKEDKIEEFKIRLGKEIDISTNLKSQLSNSINIKDVEKIIKEMKKEMWNDNGFMRYKYCEETLKDLKSKIKSK